MPGAARGPVPLTLGRPSPARLGAVLEAATAQAPTYPEVGATAGDLPPGCAHLRRRVVVGSGERVFERVAEGVRHWRVQQRAGLLVHASAPTTELGSTAVLAVRLGPVWRLAACRVVRVLDEPHRRGFAYGTLPGHPERGEEAFVVEREASGAVVFSLTVFSALASWDARALPPAARGLQLLITARYLRAVRALASG